MSSQYSTVRHSNEKSSTAVKKLAQTQKKPQVELHLQLHAESTKNVTTKYIIPTKQAKTKTKKAKTPKTILETIPKPILNAALKAQTQAKESTKLLELAMINAALFQHLAK